MNIVKSEKTKLKAKRTFLKKGTCSRTFFYILNNEFGHPKDLEERAVDPLAGGIAKLGYQCGMLWGASMAVGAESFRRFEQNGKATGIAITTTQRILDSFKNRTQTIECEDITGTDFSKKWGLAKLLFSGKAYSCLKLTGKWAPESINIANKELSNPTIEFTKKPLSCASEVVKKMGGSDEEIAMVAGFAGGLGLSGSGCGALAASIWKTVLELIRDDKWQPALSDPDTENIIKAFYEETNYEVECHKICGKRFDSIDDHTEFIKNGGCKKLIYTLSKI
jgi:putative redox-active protein with C_GCAxxG_C_C motif